MKWRLIGRMEVMTDEWTEDEKEGGIVDGTHEAIVYVMYR
jgi:hypothetical protein